MQEPYGPGVTGDDSDEQTGRVCEVDMDEAYYLGTGEDGVYFAAAQEGEEPRWFASAIVDCNSNHSCGAAVLTDDGPYASQARALEAGLDAAYEWLITNEFFRGWRTDEKRLRREFRRMGKQEAKRNTPQVGDATVVEQWKDGRWIERKLIWNGKRYVTPREVN